MMIWFGMFLYLFQIRAFVLLKSLVSWLNDRLPLVVNVGLNQSACIIVPVESGIDVMMS